MSKNPSRYIITVLICLWISGIICRSTNHKPSIEAPAHIHQGNKSTLRALRNLGEIDAGYPEWEDDLTFSFEQFADDNELNMAKRAMLGVIDMLQTTMSIMYPDTIVITDPWPAPTSDPSLERYFQAANIPKVAEVFKRLLAALGAPGFKNLIDCYHDQLLTMKIVYGDYWGTGSPTDCQDDPDAIAYSNWETDDEHADEAFGVTCLCPMFFEEYKDYSNPTPPILYNAPSIDEGDVMDTVQIPCYTSSLTLLHEFLHWAAMGHTTLGYIIEDQIIFDWTHGKWTKAYRAFYSMKMLDTTWNTQHWSELSNVDNYVYAVQEIYWGRRTNRQIPWNDPLQFPGYFAPNAPPQGIV